MTRMRRMWLAAFGVVLVVGGLLSRFASQEPDGLERVATDHGFDTLAPEQHGLLQYGGATAVIGIGIVLLVVTAITGLVRRGR